MAEFEGYRHVRTCMHNNSKGKALYLRIKKTKCKSLCVLLNGKLSNKSIFRVFFIGIKLY